MTSKKKSTRFKFLSMFLVLGFILSTFVPTSQASGTSQKDSQFAEERKQLISNFLELGIDKTTANKLADKVVRGELLDAQKPSELDKVQDQLTISSQDKAPKHIEFADGSRIQLEFEGKEEARALSGDIGTLDYATGTVTNNSCTSGSGYKNCNVTARYNDGVWNVRFNASVSYAQGAYDSISSISKPAVDAVLYSVVKKKFSRTKTKENSSGPAKAEYTNQFTHKTGLYTISRTLTLYTGKDTSYARLNYY